MTLPKNKPAGPGGPINNRTEISFETPGGELAVVQRSNPKGTNYVRIVDMSGPCGTEQLYWHKDEWTENPTKVMGDIFAVLHGGSCGLR